MTKSASGAGTVLRGLAPRRLVVGIRSRGGGEDPGRFVWGLIDQAFSSASNFLLPIIAAHALGPEGVGIVFIGFAFYLMVSGFERALLLTPLISASAPLGREARTEAIRCGLTVGFIAGVAVSAASAGFAAAVGGDIGLAVLAYTPWLIPALMQDFTRAVLFQERRGAAAAANDAVRFLTMVLMIPLAFEFRSVFGVVSCWGLGALLAMLLGFLQLGVRPVRPRRAFAWWRDQAWPFGRWLAAEGIAYSIGAYLLVPVLAALIGPSGYGGLVVVQSIFGPSSLVATAVALPGLPALARRRAVGREPATRLALRLTSAVVALGTAYVAIMAVVADLLVVALYGESFEPFTTLLWPIAAGQLMLFCGTGFDLLLRVEKRGSELLAIRIVASVATFAAVSLLAWSNGVVGAAWGLAVGFAVSTAATVAVALRPPRQGPSTRG